MLGRLDRNLHLILASVIGVMACLHAPSSADSSKLEQRLNDSLFEGVTESNRSAQLIFDAYLTVSDPPVPVGADFNLTTIWPGMPGWNSVASWAAANEQMGEALKKAEEMIVLGMPYGISNVSSEWQSRNIVIEVAPNGDMTLVDYPYLDAMDGVAAWATAEFYRLLEAEKYEEAFQVGLSLLRVLRQGCEQEMLDEKLWFMDTLSDALSTHRDAMFAYLGKIPAATLKEVATKEYPFLKNPPDDQRMKRLEMPEGDRIVAEEMLAATFGPDGQPDTDRFTEVFGAFQARDAPLTRFGTKQRWERLSSLHGSIDASQEKLTDVYDDWWRRWRMRQYESMMNMPTEFSRLNAVRFAAVHLAVQDLKEAFRSRERLIANFNGTMLSAGLCGYHETYGGWPVDLSPVYTVFAIKRFDFDPYNKEYGRLNYRKLSSRRAVDTEYGRVWLTGAMLYALGQDHADDGVTESSNDGSTGELVLWPPVRQLARDEKLID